MKAPTDHNESGFTVLEALVSFFILTLILASTVQLIGLSIKMDGRAAQLDTAITKVQEIHAVQLPKLLEEAASSRDRIIKRIDGWKITINRVQLEDGDPVSTFSQTGLYHIKTEQIDGSKGSVFQTFRVINQPAAGF